VHGRRHPRHVEAVFNDSCPLKAMYSLFDDATPML
jgi:hypothetical protein